MNRLSRKPFTKLVLRNFAQGNRLNCETAYIFWHFYKKLC